MDPNLYQSTIPRSSGTQKRAREEEDLDRGRPLTIRRTQDVTNVSRHGRKSIHDFPVEILCKIFSFLPFCAPSAGSPHQIPSWLSFILVCRHLHDVAVKFKQHWIDIPLMTARMTEMMLQRTSPLLVNLHGDESWSPSPTPRSQGMHIALEALPRVRSITLDKGCDTTCFDLLCLSLEKGMHMAPNLTTLSIRALDLTQTQPWDHVGWRLDRLSRSTWAYLGHRLEVLEIHIPIWSSLKRMTRALRHLPKLQRLELGRFACVTSHDKLSLDSAACLRLREEGFLPALQDLVLVAPSDTIRTIFPHGSPLRTAYLVYRDVRNILSHGCDPFKDMMPSPSTVPHASYTTLSLSLSPSKVDGKYHVHLSCLLPSPVGHGLPQELCMGFPVALDIHGMPSQRRIHDITTFLLSVVADHPAFTRVRRVEVGRHLMDYYYTLSAYWGTLGSSTLGRSLEEIEVANTAVDALLRALASDPALFPALRTLRIRNYNLLNFTWMGFLSRPHLRLCFVLTARSDLGKPFRLSISECSVTADTIRIIQAAMGSTSELVWDGLNLQEPRNLPLVGR